MSINERISAEEAERLLAEHDNVMLLDMRDARAYCQGHDPRAIHLSDLTLRTLLKATPKQVHMLIYGRERDTASQDMANLFREFGFDRSFCIDGGYEAWQARGHWRQRPTTATRIAARA